jgi:hypothetical protein
MIFKISSNLPKNFSKLREYGANFDIGLNLIEKRE